MARHTSHLQPSIRARGDPCGIPAIEQRHPNMVRACADDSTWPFRSFLAGSTHSLRERDMVRFAYRTRAMVAHLRDANRRKVKIPMRFKHMRSLVEQMSVEPESVSSIPDKPHACTTEPDVELIETTPEKPCHVAVISDAESSISEWSFDVLCDGPHMHPTPSSLPGPDLPADCKPNRQ